MKKSLSVIVLFAVMVAASLAFTEEEPKYRNLKVLPKNTTKQQMDSVMRHFAGSLGVKCNFCHVRNEAANTMDWASDKSEHKSIARQMMRMTNKINKKYFKVSGAQSLRASSLLVSCYTCHNGKAEPEVNAPKPSRPQVPPPPPPTGPQPNNKDTIKQQP